MQEKITVRGHAKIVLGHVVRYGGSPTRGLDVTSGDGDCSLREVPLLLRLKVIPRREKKELVFWGSPGPGDAPDFTATGRWLWEICPGPFCLLSLLRKKL